MCLPYLAGQDNAPDAGPHAPALDAAEKRLKVMVVDDNIDAAHMLGMFLEALGHRVLIEHHPWKAIERARIETPDVFLLDIGLPEMDGHELVRRLRSDPETAQALFIAVTGYSQEQDRDTALHAGFDHHFAKPVDSARLAGLLSDSLSG